MHYILLTLGVCAVGTVTIIVDAGHLLPSSLAPGELSTDEADDSGSMYD